MEVSLHSDYSFRVLMYLALHDETLTQIKSISDAYGISEYHLIKVVQNLVKIGYVESFRGRNGGIKLAVHPSTINLGQVFRQTEPSLRLLTCFDIQENTCTICGICDLQGVFDAALRGFLRELDAVSLEDVISNKKSLRKALKIPG